MNTLGYHENELTSFCKMSSSVYRNTVIVLVKNLMEGIPQYSYLLAT